MNRVRNTIFFLFQAEDGIRYLVRSRGLGDVYKRQERHPNGLPLARHQSHSAGLERHLRATTARSHIDNPVDNVDPVDHEVVVRPPIVPELQHHRNAVSYTHLTLPTSDLV